MAMHDEIKELIRLNSSSAYDQLYAIADESGRVATVAGNARNIINDLDAQFEHKTQLDSRDWGFVVLATMLQLARWVIINKVSKFGDTADSENRPSHDDKTVKDNERRERDEFKRKHYRENEKVKGGKYRNWLQILYEAAPYDAIQGTDFSGRDHRQKTLGHDPFLGWIFGTMNFLTTSMTTTEFVTQRVVIHPLRATDEYIGLAQLVQECWESAKEDKLRIPAAIFAQGVHLESDKYTKAGLPIPILGTFAEDLAGALYSEGYDYLCACRDLKIIGSQLSFSILIDMIIGLIHGLFYDRSKYPSRDIYEVKTRKILCYSKVISSTTNVLTKGLQASFGDASALKDLDFGGIIWTLIDMVKSTTKIQELKRQFISKKFFQMISGDFGEKSLIEITKCYNNYSFENPIN